MWPQILFDVKSLWEMMYISSVDINYKEPPWFVSSSLKKKTPKFGFGSFHRPLYCLPSHWLLTKGKLFKHFAQCHPPLFDKFVLYFTVRALCVFVFKISFCRLFASIHEHFHTISINSFRNKLYNLVNSSVTNTHPNFGIGRHHVWIFTAMSPYLQ